MTGRPDLGLPVRSCDRGHRGLSSEEGNSVHDDADYTLVAEFELEVDEHETDRSGFTASEERLLNVLGRGNRIGIALRSPHPARSDDPDRTVNDIGLMLVVHAHPECRFVWSRLVVDLSDPPGATIEDMVPKEVDETAVEIETRIGADLKFATISKPVNISRDQELARKRTAYFPTVTASGPGFRTAYWDFTAKGDEYLHASRELRLLVSAPAGSPVMAALTVRVRVRLPGLRNLIALRKRGELNSTMCLVPASPPEASVRQPETSIGTVEKESDTRKRRDTSEGRDNGLVAVLTALDLEYQAVQAHLSAVSRSVVNGTVFRIGVLSGSGLRIALASTGDGNLGAAAVSTRAITAFTPRALVFVGIAGALKDDIALGDVVVAERIYAYHGGKEHDGQFLVRPRSFEASHELLQFAHDLAREHPEGAPGPDSTMRPFRVHFKPIAAGEAVLDSATGPILEHLRLHFNDTAAIEMEGAGAAVAAHIGAVPALVIRGISDRADGNKHTADAGGSQPEAAANAASFAMAVLRDWSVSTRPTAGSADPSVPAGTEQQRSVPEAPGTAQAASARSLASPQEEPPIQQWVQNVGGGDAGSVINAVQGGNQHNYYMDAPGGWSPPDSRYPPESATGPADTQATAPNPDEARS